MPREPAPPGAEYNRIVINPTTFSRWHASTAPVTLPALADLNDSQRQAASHVDGPLLVLAGPGSGKTRVVTRRIAHLIAQGIPARQIVALTFTNKAADEMRRRVTDLVGPQPVEMGTFHRFAARLLRRHASLVGLTSDYSILDPDDAAAVLKRAARKLGLSLTHTPIDRLAGTISRAKNDLLSPETFSPRWGRPADEVALRLWPVYQEFLLAANSVDFDDLLVHTARLLTDNPELRAILDARHRYVLVDEYQDTNAAQYCIVRGLSIDHPNLAVTGDPDQAIYGWRGASIRNILEFERDYPSARVVKLEHNYRSTANILGTADRLIAHNSRRKPKRLVTDAAAGARVRLVLDATSRDEADRIADEIAAGVAGGRSPREYCVLFRTNALSRSLEVALRSRGVPYQLVRGLEFFKRREIRDVVAWLRLLRNPRDDEAFSRVVNVPPRGIGRQSLDLLAAWAEDHRVSRLEAASRAAVIAGLTKRAAKALGEFGRLHDALAAVAAADASVAALLTAVVDRTGYRAWLADDGIDEEGEDRVANVEELLTAAQQFDQEFAGRTPQDQEPTTDALGTFLETTALVADTDVWDPASERVALMTLHAAKGLEFPIVYLIAMEDGILPHERSLDHPDQLEEERRLVFVGITRGMQEVHASCARIRDYRGTRRISAPSVFLTEMTGSETELTGAEAPLSGGLGGFDFDDAPARRSWDATDDASQVAAGPADEDISQDIPSAPQPAPKRPRTARDQAFQTAAELAEKLSGPPAAKRTYTAGQRVRHVEYGEGVLSGISGTGPRSVGTVIFDGPAGTRKFILGHGSLEPVE
jgi:DNA helicase-2/ATP-dependent DNA helicase PcrA